MSKILGLMAIVALLVGFGLRLGAEEGGGKKAKPVKAGGEIVRVDTTDEGSTLVIKLKAKKKKKGDEAPPAEEKSFTLTDETEIIIDGAAGEIAGLEAGKQAQVLATAEGVATKVTAGKAPKKKAKKKKGAAEGDPPVDEGAGDLME